MVVLNVVTMNDMIVREYVSSLETNSNLLPLPMLSVKSKVMHEDKSKRMMWTSLFINIKIPNVWLIGPLLSIIGFVFGNILVIIFGGVIYAFGIFWSGLFIYLVFKKGLKKYGYTGIVKRISSEKLIEVVVDGTK